MNREAYGRFPWTILHLFTPALPRPHSVLLAMVDQQPVNITWHLPAVINVVHNIYHLQWSLCRLKSPWVSWQPRGVALIFANTSTRHDE